MTEANPSRRVQRQRERKAAKATDRATVARYNREGLEGIVDAIGAGEPDDWPQEGEE